MSQAAADALASEALELFRLERYDEAASKFQRAITVFPQHAIAWKGLGHSLLCLTRPHEAARAFDQAVGFRPDSATALWGGALAHADIGNKVIAQNYLRRALVLQPTWVAMAEQVAQLAPFLEISVRAGDRLRAVLGSFATRTFRHASDANRAIEVGRVANSPVFGTYTFVTVGLSNTAWKEPERPRIELVMASTVDQPLCGAILANLAFHLGSTGFFPEPGTMVRDVIGSLGGELAARLPHVYLRVPNKQWGFPLPLEVGPPAITLAQVCPLSEAEYQTWRRLGPVVFEGHLADTQVDLTDLTRAG